MTDTITIKIHKATRQRLKLLAVRSGETLMDCIERLAIEETQRVDQQESNTREWIDKQIRKHATPDDHTNIHQLSNNYYPQESKTMSSKQHSQVTKEIAAAITRIVIDNGRITASVDDHEAWLTELENEVEFEASEQGYDNSTDIAAAAIELHR